MSKEIQELKHFNMRLPKDTWMFLKRAAAAQEESMTDIIVRCVEKYRKKVEPKLTPTDTNV